jgi:hypothetical protein
VARFGDTWHVPPDATHTEPNANVYTQHPPLSQLLFAQHGLPGRPHCTQVVFRARQPSCALRQGCMPLSAVQQGSFSWPHSHVPATQSPAPRLERFVQFEAFGAQRPPDPELRSSEQHAPAALHMSPAQQGLPVTPQDRQMPFPLRPSHTMVDPLQAEFVQHGSPESPQ